MSTIRFILAIAILLLAGYVVVMNWGCVIVSMNNKRRGIDWHHSTVPILSVILVALASLTYPRPDTMWMIYVPLLDIANWSLLWLPVVLIEKREQRKSPNKKVQRTRAKRSAQAKLRTSFGGWLPSLNFELASIRHVTECGFSLHGVFASL